MIASGQQVLFVHGPPIVYIATSLGLFIAVGATPTVHMPAFVRLNSLYLSPPSSQQDSNFDSFYLSHGLLHLSFKICDIKSAIKHDV